MNAMGPMIKAAVGDTLITFLWVFCASSVGALTSVIASALNAHGVAGLSLLITTSLFALLIFTFNLIADAMGGASFNPTGNAAFYAAGHGGDTLLSMALRFPAQVVGAAGGALAIAEYVPSQYKHMVGGPSLKVGLHSGALFEGFLTYIITLAVLWIMIKGPRSPIIKAWMLAVSTVTLIVSGSSLTGPSMNPANAFGWAYLDNRHNTWEQFYVYWIAPFIGAILAAWVFKVLFPPTKPKSKKAKKA